MPPDRNGTLEHLADLTLTLGANLQPDQILMVTAELEHAPLVRAVSDLAYRRGARFVDVYWFDPYVKRARIEHADENTLDFVPSWYAERALAKGEQRCAGVTITGPTDPHAFDDLDPGRAGRDFLPRV